MLIGAVLQFEKPQAIAMGWRRHNLAHRIDATFDGQTEFADKIGLIDVDALDTLQASHAIALDKSQSGQSILRHLQRENTKKSQVTKEQPSCRILAALRR